MFQQAPQVNDIVEFMSEDMLAPNHGIIAHISSDPDMKPILVRTAQGEEQRIMPNEITGVINTDVLNGMISLYFLQQFGRYKAEEISNIVNFTITAEASSSAKEVAVKHTARIGYGDTFSSSSLAVSLSKIIERHRENTRYEVKALPAS